jgi:ubiquinone/menaquinone biosynthesis C-methylase UbiE
VDPNDVGDLGWGDPLPHIQKRYLPWIGPDSVVLELGPGTGRVTRHVIGRCGEMILVDYSRFVCDWLEKYLAGKGRFRVCCIDRPAMPMVADDSVDFAFAYGVFEHIGLDDMCWFLGEFDRVLRPGGRVSFNFDNVMSPGGIEHLLEMRREPGHANVFRFYHPETVCRLAEVAGLTVADLTTDASRLADIDLVKQG